MAYAQRKLHGLRRQFTLPGFVIDAEQNLGMADGQPAVAEVSLNLRVQLQLQPLGERAAHDDAQVGRGLLGVEGVRAHRQSSKGSPEGNPPVPDELPFPLGLGGSP